MVGLMNSCLGFYVACLMFFIFRCVLDVVRSANGK